MPARYLPGRVGLLTGAALLLGVAGYAVQGHPTAPGVPARQMKAATTFDAEEIALRDSMIEKYTADGAYLTAADAMARYGEPRVAVLLMIGGIGRYPDSYLLWSELGTTLAAHDRAMSPPALFAFRRAMRLAPRHPAPRYRLGLAQAMAGDLAGAAVSWRRALALTPPGAPYRDRIAERLAMVGMLGRRYEKGRGNVRGLPRPGKAIISRLRRSARPSCRPTTRRGRRLTRCCTHRATASCRLRPFPEPYA